MAGFTEENRRIFERHVEELRALGFKGQFTDLMWIERSGSQANGGYKNYMEWMKKEPIRQQAAKEMNLPPPPRPQTIINHDQWLKARQSIKKRLSELFGGKLPKGIILNTVAFGPFLKISEGITLKGDDGLGKLVPTKFE
jgi:hypothetical protein